jgi:intracellular multiplication protein IcmJ
VQLLPSLSITLGVSKKLGAGGTPQNRSKLKSLTEKTLSRDDSTCRYCGFKAKKFQRVIPSPDIQNKGDSWVTVCFFCEQCLNLDQTGMTGTGILIWLPEIAQTDLNHVMRAIYMIRDTDHPLAATAGRVLEVLTSRRTEAKKRLGSDDPLLLATVLHESLTESEYAQRAPKLEGIRLMPLDRLTMRSRAGDENVFPQVVKYWRSSGGPFGKLPEEKWTSLFESVLSKVGTQH